MPIRWHRIKEGGVFPELYSNVLLFAEPKDPKEGHGIVDGVFGGLIGGRMEGAFISLKGRPSNSEPFTFWREEVLSGFILFNDVELPDAPLLRLLFKVFMKSSKIPQDCEVVCVRLPSSERSLMKFGILMSKALVLDLHLPDAFLQIPLIYAPTLGMVLHGERVIWKVVGKGELGRKNLPFGTTAGWDEVLNRWGFFKESSV